MANSRVITYAEINRLVRQASMRLSAAELGWIAGIIDGEGTITVTPRSRTDRTCVNHGWQVTVRVANTDPRIINRLCELMMLVGGSSGYVQEKRPNRCKRQYYWLVAARRALVLLKLVEPYLVSKRDQALVAIELQERISTFTGIHPVGRDSLGRVKGSQLEPGEVEYRHALFRRIKYLNRRGPDRQEAEASG